MKKLTAQYLRELLHYDPETGVFTWIVRRPGVAADSIAGWLNGEGYRQITIDGVHHCANRLAWLYMTGEWPAAQIDHRDGVRNNDRFDNLREATGTQNQRNSRKRRDNASGFKGVHFNTRDKRWMAKIRRDGRQRHLGCFATAAEAHAAYCKAAMEIDPEFARFG